MDALTQWGGKSFHNIYIYEIITVYTLTVWQFYLSIISQESWKKEGWSLSRVLLSTVCYITWSWTFGAHVLGGQWFPAEALESDLGGAAMWLCPSLPAVSEKLCVSPKVVLSLPAPKLQSYELFVVPQSTRLATLLSLPFLLHVAALFSC